MKTHQALNAFLPIALFAVFFIVQVAVRPGESALTVLVLAITVLVFFIRRFAGELTLWLVGLGTGLFVEVVLGLVARQQHWDDASLLGVPMWLPLVWALGVVAITRAGIAVRRRFGDIEVA
jgi:hypothetical protein